MIFSVNAPFCSAGSLVEEGCRWLDELLRPSAERVMSDDREVVAEARAFFEDALCGLKSVAPIGRSAAALVSSAEVGLRRELAPLLMDPPQTDAIDGRYVRHLRGWMTLNFGDVMRNEDLGRER